MGETGRLSARAWKRVLAGVAFAAVLGFLALEVAALRREMLAPPLVATEVDAGEKPPPDIEASAQKIATYSNIYKYDYVGPDACGKCHAKNFESWRGHPHSKMTRNAGAASVVADFSGTRLAYGGGSVVFSKGLGEYRMTLYRDAKFVRQFKVTRTVGSRFVQMFVGVQTDGPEPPDDPVYTLEAKLPFAYWIERKEWFPETYDETRSREYDDAGQLTSDYAFLGKPRSQWKRVCIKCHNTYPYASRFEGASGNRLVGFPPQDITLRSAKRPGHELPELEPFDLVTLGISCESCHFGGREHALAGATISFLPKSQDLDFPKATEQLVTVARSTAYVVNGICNQCHSAEANGPMFANGASSWNAREAQDLMGGACASKLACTTCHNPHQAGPTTADGPDSKLHLGSCVGCHDKYRDAKASAAHSRHQPSVSCLDCHMPRIVHGLGGMVRTHRISSPTDAKMFAAEQPNACNVCHLDKSTAWTLRALADGWNKKIEVPSLAAPDEPLGARWLAHKEPTVRNVAVDAWSRTPIASLRAGAAEHVFPSLLDESPPNRMFGVLAVERVLGRKVDVDEYTPWAAPAVRRKQVAAVVERPR